MWPFAALPYAGHSTNLLSATSASHSSPPRTYSTTRVPLSPVFDVRSLDDHTRFVPFADRSHYTPRRSVQPVVGTRARERVLAVGVTLIV